MGFIYLNRPMANMKPSRSLVPINVNLNGAPGVV